VEPSSLEKSPKLTYRIDLAGLNHRLVTWLMDRLPNERQRLLIFTILAGGLCGLAAVAFHASCGLMEAMLINRATSASGNSWIWWTILTPALGGLVTGIALYYVVPAAAGSGIPQVKVAFVTRSGYVSVKETVGKFVLCAIQLGTGGSLGVEGPTVHICAGVSKSATCWPASAVSARKTAAE
jgi:CIC family chloride channel protein